MSHKVTVSCSPGYMRPPRGPCLALVQQLSRQIFSQPFFPPGNTVLLPVNILNLKMGACLQFQAGSFPPASSSGSCYLSGGRTQEDEGGDFDPLSPPGHRTESSFSSSSLPRPAAAVVLFEMTGKKKAPHPESVVRVIFFYLIAGLDACQFALF